MKQVKVHEKEMVWTYQKVRVFATILVVIGHCLSLSIGTQSGVINPFQSVEGLYAPAIAEFIRNIIYSFHMPLFVMLSGAVFSVTFRDNLDGKWIWKKVKRLVIPYFITALFIYIPVRILVGYYEDVDLLKIVVQDVILGYDINYLWYVIMLFEVSIIMACISRWVLSNQRKIQMVMLILFLGIYMCRYFVPQMPFQLNYVMEFLLWFYAGILLDKSRKHWNGINWKCVLIVAIIIWIVTFGLHYSLENYVEDIVSVGMWAMLIKLMKIPIRVVLQLAGSIAIISLFVRNTPIENKALSSIEKNSYDIYLIHVPIIMLYKVIICYYFPVNSMNNVVYMLLLFIGCFGAIVLSNGLSNIFHYRMRKTN